MQVTIMSQVLLKFKMFSWAVKTILRKNSFHFENWFCDVIWGGNESFGNIEVSENNLVAMS